MNLELAEHNPKPAHQKALEDLGTTVRPADPYAEYKAEVDTYYRVLKMLTEMTPVEVFNCLSAFSARASEMRTRLFRVDNNRANAFRTREIEPLIEEIDRQFRVHSRIMSYKEFEMKLSGERGLS